MSRLRVGRTLVVLALTAPMSGVLLLAGAPAASAAVSSPGAGAVFTDGGATVAIRASYTGSTITTRAHELRLTSPGGATRVVAAVETRSSGTLAYDLRLGCWTFPSSGCSGSQPAPNGTWTVEQAGAEADRVTFVTRVAPQPPTSVDAAVRSARQVQVTWRRGAEPDLTGFAVFEGDRAVVDGIGTSACSDGACSAVVDYPDDRPGEHTYVVRAYRSLAPGSSETLASGASAPASASIAGPAPTQEPTADPVTGGPSSGGSTGGTGSTGGSTGGTSGGSTGGGSTSGGSPAPGSTTGGTSSGGTGTGGTSTGGRATTPGSGGPTTAAGGSARPGSPAQAVAQRQAFASGFSAFGPKLGIPKLPPLPQTQSPSIADDVLPDGTFEESLGFEDQVLTERVDSLSPGARVTSALGSAFDSERFARSTAGALVLLMAAAHVRRFLATPAED